MTWLYVLAGFLSMAALVFGLVWLMTRQARRAGADAGLVEALNAEARERQAKLEEMERIRARALELRDIAERGDPGELLDALRTGLTRPVSGRPRPAGGADHRGHPGEARRPSER